MCQGLASVAAPGMVQPAASAELLLRNRADLRKSYFILAVSEKKLTGQSDYKATEENVLRTHIALNLETVSKNSPFVVLIHKIVGS